MHNSRALGRLTRLFCLTLLALSLPAQAQAQLDRPTASAGRPQGGSAQPVRQGRLSNGLQYAILPRRANEPGVGLFMQVQGGFLAERRPGERGLAHLIEHLAFHSPTRSAPDDPHRFRNIGMKLTFEAPAGGTTIWRESDYFLVSRTTSPADLDTLLGLFREVASELTFRPDIVDQQRAEVMREMADKKLGNLISARYIESVAPGSPNDVIDAQNSDDVPTASVATIRGLYQRLYRPENTSIIVVGDIDPRQIAELIEKRFGNWRGVGHAPARAAIPVFRSDAIAPISLSALAEGRRSATITIASPLRPSARSRREQAEASVMDMVAMRAVNERLALSQAAGPPGKYGTFIENGDQGPYRLIMLWDNFAPGGGRPAVAGLKTTACDLATTGLSQQEWARAKQYVLQDLEARAAGMSNFDLARQLADELAVGRDPISPGELLLHARALLPTIGAQAMNLWWRRQWSAGAEHIRVEAPELARIDNPAAAIRAAADEAARNARCRLRPA